ncbi:DUF2334 domain-containing protein [Lachnoclostridium sp. Marseille-P6806]|uniref:DUF2334 domain-containing protein n=1 Tax=Lachnoclostridium sp. Marseille-P6806 TaxID=2364793 RepID=UPI001031D41D|nr:DUF2334 domain-containing protein [Lachnoclostridium sp. Marseille-P6806]
MKIALRMDDITADMDWARFRRMKALLDRAGIRPLIGVVPSPQDAGLHFEAPHEDFWASVRQWKEAGWTIAMHGLTHVYTTADGGMFPLNRQSEFAGLSLSRQRDMIAEGKRLLAEQGIRTDIFMAPSHSYDRSTLTALKDNGFTRITDGFGRAPYRCAGMTFYPISADRRRALAARRGMTTFVLHTNTMTESDFAFYETLLEGGKVISYDELLQCPAGPRGPLGCALEYGMARGKRFLVGLRTGRG